MILRRIVLILLLFSVPFQAAVGSTGFVCGHGVQFAGADAAAVDASHALAHEHDRAMHRHGSSHDGGDVHDAGTCSLCSECSFSAAPVSASTPNAECPPAVLKVTLYVDPTALRYAGDDLFRPPRTIRS